MYAFINRFLQAGLGGGGAPMEKSERSLETGNSDKWYRFCPVCGRYLNKKTGEEKVCDCGWVWR